MVFPISFMICIENRNQQPPVKNQTNVDRFVNSEALKSEDFSDVDETITYRLKKGDASKTSLSDCLYESEREIVSNSREQVYLNWLVAGGSLNENQLRDSFRCLSLMVTPLETQNCSSSCTNAIKIVATDRSCGCETMQSKAKDFNGLDLSIEKDISHCSLRCDEAFDEKLILHCMDKYPPLDHHPDHLSSSTRKEIQAQSCTLRADESIKSTVPRTLADWTRAIKKTISEKIADLNSEHREIFMSPISPNLDSAKLLVDDIPPFRVRLSLRDVTVKTEMVDRIHRRLYDALAVLKGMPLFVITNDPCCWYYIELG